MSPPRKSNSNNNRNFVLFILFMFFPPNRKADIRNPLRYLLMNADRIPLTRRLVLRTLEAGECLSAILLFTDNAFTPTLQPSSSPCRQLLSAHGYAGHYLRVCCLTPASKSSPALALLTAAAPRGLTHTDASDLPGPSTYRFYPMGFPAW